MAFGDMPVRSVGSVSGPETDEILTDARAWVADCLGRTGLASARLALVFVAKHYPGGWAGYNAEASAYVVVK